MNAQELVSQMAQDRVSIGLDAKGGLRCYGDRAKAEAWLPTLRQHKQALLKLLAETKSHEIRPENVHPNGEPLGQAEPTGETWAEMFARWDCGADTGPTAEIDALVLELKAMRAGRVSP